MSEHTAAFGGGVVQRSGALDVLRVGGGALQQQQLGRLGVARIGRVVKRRALMPQSEQRA